MAGGAATTTVYPSSTPPECQYILSDSDTQIVFAEDDSQVAKLREVRDQLPSLRRVIVIDGQGDGDWVTTLDELMAAGKEWNEANPGAVDERVESLRPEHLATLIYTSGTTGQPKGVRLLHRCWLYEATAMGAEKRRLSYVPLGSATSAFSVVQTAACPLNTRGRTFVLHYTKSSRV